MAYMDDVFYATEVASPGASTLVVEELQCGVLYATEVAAPEFDGASTLVADKQLIDNCNATEVASPRRR